MGSIEGEEMTRWWQSVWVHDGVFVCDDGRRKGCLRACLAQSVERKTLNGYFLPLATPSMRHVFARSGHTISMDGV